MILHTTFDNIPWEFVVMMLMFFVFVLVLLGIFIFVRWNARNNRKRVEDIAANVSVLYKYTEETNRRLRDADEKIAVLTRKAGTLPPSVKAEVAAVEKSLFKASALNEQVLAMCDVYMDQRGIERAVKSDAPIQILDPEPVVEEEIVPAAESYVATEADEKAFARKKASYNISDDLFIQKLKDLIDKNLASPELSVAQLAEELCVSRSGLFAKVKAAVGDTPNNMITDARLAKAQQLLVEGKKPISEICYLVGFSSPSYFSRCFDKKFGMTPHAWMTMMKKKESDKA